MNAVDSYDYERISVATMASHTSLQLLKAAKKHGFKTIALTPSENTAFYSRFSFIDIVVEVSAVEIEKTETMLLKENAIFIPHGSFVEYCGSEKAKRFGVPFFGTRGLIEVESNQRRKMELLRRAGIPTPKSYDSVEEAEVPVIVKLGGAKGGRGYFIALDKEVLRMKLDSKCSDYIIQEYVVGVPVYVHYFSSPIYGRVEIFGADVRYESNVDGRVFGLEEPSFTVVGNKPVVLRESLLPKYLNYGEAFTEAVEKELGEPMIGPFCLESIIRPDLSVKVFEFSGRIVAGTNVYMGVGSPYSTLYHESPLDMGGRIALEIREAVKRGALREVTT